MRTIRLAATALLLCCAATGQAQGGPGERVLQGLRDCKAIAGSEARLACFDKATAALEAAVDAKDVRIVDRQEIRKARRSLFGFTIPKVALFGGGDGDEQDAKDDEDAFTEINTTVASARSVDNGRAEIRLVGEDAVWRTTDPLAWPPKAGAKIRIRKGTLGNYFIAVDGRSVRGMRVR
jgi:hypothetical protein